MKKYKKSIIISTLCISVFFVFCYLHLTGIVEFKKVYIYRIPTKIDSRVNNNISIAKKEGYINNSICGNVRTVNYTDDQHVACSVYDASTHTPDDNGKIWIYINGRKGYVPYRYGVRYLAYHSLDARDRTVEQEKEYLYQYGIKRVNNSSVSEDPEIGKFLQKNPFNYAIKWDDYKFHYDKDGNLLTFPYPSYEKKIRKKLFLLSDGNKLTIKYCINSLCV